MLCIFLREISMLCRDFPIDAEGIIKDRNASISLRMIEVITLVLEDGSLGEDGEAMGKALWYEELDMIVFCQFYCHVLAISRGALANIYSYIDKICKFLSLKRRKIADLSKTFIN